jgi:hypothetical protein
MFITAKSGAINLGWSKNVFHMASLKGPFGKIGCSLKYTFAQSVTGPRSRQAFSANHFFHLGTPENTLAKPVAKLLPWLTQWVFCIGSHG